MWGAVTNGENAVNVLGQSSYTSSSLAISQGGVVYPSGVAMDPGGQILHVVDQYSNRVTMYDVTAITNGENAVNVAGQTNGAGSPVYTTANAYDGVPQEGIDNPYDVTVDTVAHRLFVADFYGNRVLVYNLDASNTIVDRTMDNVLGQSDFKSVRTDTTQNSMKYPSGLAFDATTNRLFVSNYGSNRVLVFDVAAITDGENAVNVLGQADFTSETPATTQSGMYTPAGLSFNSNLLYVADLTNTRVTVFDVTAITDGENAVNVLGAANFTAWAPAAAQNRTYFPLGVHHDGGTRLFVADTSNNRVLVFDTAVITDGENAVSVLGQATFTTNAAGITQSAMNAPFGLATDSSTNRLFVSDYLSARVLVFDVAVITNGENAVNVLGQADFTSSNPAVTQSGMFLPSGLEYEAGMNRLYMGDNYNNRVLVHSAGPVPPSTSTLTAVAGGQAGAIDLSWPSAGDDGVFNDLTGYYRIQYATFTATWSTSSTPTDAYTSTITATSVTPGVVQSTTVYVSPTVQPWYFVIWTQDDASNWSAISSTVSASPPPVIPDYGVGPFEVASVGGGLSQGGTAWGDFDNDGDLDVLVSGTDGTNNQVRVYESYGDGSFNSTAVNVAAATSGLKDGDVAFGDYDNDGDLDVLVNGTDGTNNQLRVYKNNGNGTFNTTAVEVAGTNSGLKQGGVAWGDYDNDGDLDVLVSGTDGTNNQLRVYTNKGDGTFDTTAINVAGLNSGLRQGSVAWGDFDQDGDMDVLVNGTNGTNRQLRVYENEGDGTFNSTGIEVAGVNSGLSDGRVVWSDFDKDGYLDVLVSGTDGTNNQLRVYMNNGNGTFNSTPVNVAGSNTGITHSAVAVGDYNVDGNQDILAAGRPTGLTGYWKLDENTGTTTADSSGNGKTGTLTGGPTWTTGKFNSGVYLDGSAQSVDSAVTTQYAVGSMAMWVNPAFSRGTAAYFYAIKGTLAGNLLHLKLDGYSATANVRIEVRGNYGSTVFASKEITSNADLQRWQHLAAVWDVNNGVWLYRDGVFVSSASGTTGTLTLSTQQMGYNFLGDIDDVRTYNRALSAEEIAGLYQATKSSIGTLRIHKGQGDGTFNATPVEVDAGLEKGNVAWGDADGDGDLDILTAGTDGANPQLSVYLSTQSLTASNTAPSAPGTLAGSFAFDPSGVSVASFTWTAGTDSGTGTTTENALNYELQISTKSDFNPLVVPGNQGASPRMGAYLRPPKTFAGSTYGVMLKSTDPWNAQTTAGYGLRTDTTYYYQVKTVDAGLATSGWSTSGTLNTGVAPSTSTLGASAGTASGEILLSWSSAGDDGTIGDLTGNYRIQYATYTVSWSTTSTPTDATTVTIATTSATPGSSEENLVTGLTDGITYYFVLWTQDDASNWSAISSTVSASPPSVIPDFGVGPFEVASVGGGLSQGGTAWGDFDNDGDLDVVVSGTDGTNNQVRVYESYGDGTFNSTAVNVAAANSGLKDGDVAFGDYDNDGDLDVLVNGTDGANNQLRVYKNNGNGTFNTTAVEVAGTNSGLKQGGVAWGDFDNDGDLDVLVSGTDGTNNQLRVYTNKGDGTFDTTAINVAGLNSGLRQGSVAWGDFDQDGDVDVLVNGTEGTNRQLRVYENEGDGTFNSTGIEVAGVNSGLSDGRVVWSDFDKDGYLDVLVSGTDGTNNQLRVYMNNGNGTFNSTAVNVAGANMGVTNSAVAVGDYNVDGNQDILAAGRPTGLVGYWKFDENTGTTTADSSGNNNSGTLVNSPTWITGKYTKAIEYNGTTQYVNFPSLPSVSVPYSVSAWIKPQALGSPQTFLSLRGSNTYPIFNLHSNNKLLAYSGADKYRYGSKVFSSADLNLWWHVVFLVVDSASLTNWKVYLNGVDNTGTAASNTGTFYNPSLAGTIGNSGVGRNYFQGGIDDVRIYNRILTPEEISGLYQATKSSIGTLRLHKGQGDGTFDATPVEVDAGLEKGNVAWGDADGDGDLDILTAGTDGANPQLSVYLSTQSLTASNTAPSAPGTLAGSFAFDPSGVSVASFTWTAGTDSGTGTTTENALNYELQISTKSDFNPLVVPGDQGASPRMGAYLRPPKMFAGSTYGVMLKSTDPWNAQTTAGYGLRTDTTYYYQVKTVDAGLATSGWSTSGTLNTGVAPSTSTLGASAGTASGEILLSWSSAGDDGTIGDLTGNYRIQYATYTVSWSTTSTPTDATTVTIATTSATPGSSEENLVTGLTDGITYYFVLWTQDDASNWSAISSTVSASPPSVIPDFGVGPFEVASVGGGLSQGGTAWGDFDNDGDLDVVVSGTDGTNNQVRVYESYGDGTFNSTAVNVAAANSGLKDGDVAFGDYDNDGDLDVLVNGTDGANNQLRVYKNNGNGTFNTTAVEVAGTNSGLKQGGVAWGDYDNDGDLDVLVSGTDGTNNQLRVYKNKGDGTFDSTAINVAGLNSGLRQGSVAWGDFDQDGDVDVLVNGTEGTNRQLRVYENEGDGTFNSTGIEVAGVNSGLSDGRVVWSDFDKDGYLDVLVSGTDGTNNQLRVYMNNGNGTFNSTAVNVAGANMGVTNSAVAVGDYNVDGNQDILAAGRPTGLVGYWKFDENTGTLASDLSGQGNNLTLSGGATWATGKYGSAVFFDGVNDYVTAGADILDIPTNDFSISAWVKSTSTLTSNANGIVYKKLTGTLVSAGYQLNFPAGGFIFRIADGTNFRQLIVGSGYNDGQWHHVVAVAKRGVELRLYVDGVSQGSISETTIGNIESGVYFVIGALNASGGTTYHPFNGQIDEVRIYDGRALTAQEILGMYQATKSSIGTLRLHKGQGDGTFNATPVEVDAGLEKGNVVWGDADGDGDLDILTAGTDGANPQLSVYLSTQSLTASNTAPSAPGTLAGSFAFDPSGVSVASFTWTAGTDSGTGTTTENALNYELQISTKSDFNPLVVPGNQGASPRMGAYLRPPKTFAGSTYGVMLKSTDPWNAQTTAGYGLRTDTTYYYQVKTVDAGLATSGWSTSGTLNTGVAPSTSTLGASTGPGSGEVTLTWSSAGDDGMSGDLTGNFRIQYATYTASWSTASTPTNAFTLTISTTGVTPGVVQSTSIAGLTVGITYYFALFTEDESNNWSTVSNTTSAIGGDWFDSTQIEVDGVNNGLRYGRVAWGDFDNDGDLDILVNGTDGTYRQLRVYKNNGDGSFDPAQIEVGGANGGLQDGGVAWGDFDNDGDLDVLVSGTQGSAGRLRIYKNNGDGSFDSTPINVSSPATGHVNGGVAWGDFDNDGDLDVLANGGEGATTYQLRVYKNNGNGTMDPAPIEVAGRDLGLRLGSVAWGDFDNDGDLDILTNGFRSNHNLRVFKNNGNGTFDPTEIDVDGPGFGLSDGTVAWGDFDQDGDLDILVSGFNGTNRQLRVYKNNGNGTFDTAQIEVDGLNGGLRYSDVAWGDFDNDGDLDILVSGSDGSSPQLRVYMNNGNGTFDGTQIEVDGLNGGLQDGGVAWGDFDNDGDLDILASGYDGANSQLRVYKNSAFTVNTPPSAPATLTANWDYSPTGLSTATFKWIPGVDNGADPTPADGLTYQLEISTTSGFTGKSFVAGQWASPGVGNYLKPPKTYDGNTAHGVGLRYLPLTNTTYYFRVKTIDAGLKESAWSTTESLYTLVASSEPSAVTDLAAGEFGEGQIGLTWTAPLNIQSGGNAVFDIRYSTVGAITNDTEFTNATPITGEPTPGVTGTTHLFGVIGLEPLKTYYFAIKSTNDNGTSPLDTVSPRPSAVASYFNATQIEVDGINAGPVLGSVAWGDYDNDGDLDILVSGSLSGAQLRVYTNNGNGTFNTTQIEVAGYGQGLYYSSVAWGDFDSDGDLDILISGYNATTRELRVYKNNGNGTFNSTPIDVDGATNGLDQGGVDWGDFDNDGDLDILVCGSDGTNYQLRVFKNNGNGTFDSNQIEVDGLNGGLYRGKSVWGDFDNDGDLDILINGHDGTNPQLRVYKNNGDGTFDGTQIEVDGLNGGLYVGAVAWGDFDNDGDLDILENGYNAGFYLRVYKNNGNGTFDPDQIEIDGNNGLDYGSVAWGDYDNDGDLDVLTCGYQAGTRRHLRVYTNNGNGTFDPNQIEVDGLYGGLSTGVAVWGDYDNDGDLDILANGYDGLSIAPQLRVYTNLSQTVNTSPTEPTLLAGAFGFDPTTVSVASFTWNAGNDSGPGATPENVLTYDVQISTEMGFSPLLFPGQMGATPRMGSYQKPPKIFNTNAYYGVVLKSADPWNEQTTASYGLRTDTTYYYRVKTVDSALAESGWSGTGTLNTAVPPSTSTLVATAGAGSVTLGWDSAGDDGMIGDLTGNYRIQYATYTVSWSTASTPTDATTVTIATTSVTPGSAQSKVITGLTGDLLYYFVLWSQDEANNWSGISNTTSAVPSTPITVTLAEAVGQAGWMGRGETQRILGTAQVVSNSESGVTISSVAVQASGYTADANLTNVEVWVSSSGYIDANAIRLEDTAKAFSSNAAVFTQDVVISTTPLYFIARSDVGGSATEGTFELALQVYTTAITVNNPIAFSNATDVVAPPSGSPSGFSATPSGSLLQVSLSWGGVTGAESYTIYRATYSGLTTSDFLLTMTTSTTFTDNYIPPNQQLYYKVFGTNRAGTSSASASAGATAVDVSALTTSYIYERVGSVDYSNLAYGGSPSSPHDAFVDRNGNIFIAATYSQVVMFVPAKSGTYFGQAMVANTIFTIAGTGSASFLADGVAATAGRVNYPRGICVDLQGNIYIGDTNNHRIRFIPTTTGTYFGQSMTANYIYTIAGNGTGSYGGDGGAATSAQLNNPRGVDVDAQGNVYIADYTNHRVRFVPKASGTYFGQSMTANYIYTIAGDGTGSYGGDGGPATAGQINNPNNLSVDAGGNVSIADYSNHRVRIVPKTSGTYFGQTMTANSIYTLAGDGTASFGGDEGAATSAKVKNPYDVSYDADGNVYIASLANYRIRMIPIKSGTYFGQSMTANYIYTIAGYASSSYNGDGKLATTVGLSPVFVSLDARGNVYLAALSRIFIVAKTDGTYFGRDMTANYIYSLVGNGSPTFVEEALSTGNVVDNPAGVSVDGNGNLYYAEPGYNAVRFVPKNAGTYFGRSMLANSIYTLTGGFSGTYSGDGGIATEARLRDSEGLTIDLGGNVYIGDTDNHRIRFIPRTSGTFFGQSMTADYIYTIAGNGTGAYGGDGGAATSGQIYEPRGVSVDRSGNLYIADSKNHRIRFIPIVSGTYFGQSMTANYIYTIAGNGTGSYGGDTGAATLAQINNPYDVSVDEGGNVYVADYTNHRIRFVPKVGGTYFGVAMTANSIYTIAGNGTGGYLADNVAATSTRIRNPKGVSVDPGGNVYIGDYVNHRIRFVPKRVGTYYGQAMTANYIYTIAGDGNSTYNGENALATGKTLYYPSNVFAEGGHEVYISDTLNDRIRMVLGEDFIAPSTSTIAVTAGAQKVTLDWNSAGDDGLFNALTGNYRIQYATYTVSWSTASTPTDATTVTIGTTSVTPGSAQTKVITGLTVGTTYYFVLWTQDEVNNWSDISNTTSAIPLSTVTLAEAVGQAGWMGRGETQRILGTAQVVSDSESGVTISSVAVQASGYTADGNLTNVEVWVSSSGYIDANAIRLEDTAKAFSSNAVVFTQDVVVSTTPLYFIARSDISGSATEGTFELSLQVYTTAITANSPIAFRNATDVVAPPSGSPSGLTATAASNLLRVNLSWSGATGVDSYTIYRATHSGVNTADFILGITNTTSFADDYIPPNQLMYYTVVGANRAGGTSASGAANATSVDVPALTTSNIYLRAGMPGGLGDGNMAYGEILYSSSTTNSPSSTVVDHSGNVYISDSGNHRIRFVPKLGGTYFGQAMTANNIYTIAGNGTGGYLADNVAATSTQINSPYGLSVGAGGNVYIADRANNRIRFIPRSGGTYFGQSMTANYIYTIAGNGTGGYLADDVAATSTQVNLPRGVSVDAGGNVYIGDYGNKRIRFIPKTGGTYFGQSMTADYIYTIAGNGTPGYLADNVAATSTQIYNPSGLSVDAGGNVLFADSSNSRIRFVPKTGGTYFGQTMTANYIYTIAGNGTEGYLADNVAATSTQINKPHGLSVDAGGNIFIADTTNHRIRFVPKTGGTYFGQTMTANYIYTIAGNGSGGYLADNVAATSTQIRYPNSVSVDPGGNVYIADTYNHRIRFVPKSNGTNFGQSMTANYIYTIAGRDGGSYLADNVNVTHAPILNPGGVSVDASGNLYIADTENHRIRFVPKTGGTYFGQTMTANSIYTIAGNGTAGYLADNVAATSTRINHPVGVSVDASGNVYVAGYTNHRIRFIPKVGGTYFGQTMTANYIYTIAGNGTGGYLADNVDATSTQIKIPRGVSVDAGGNVYIADTDNQRIRFIPKVGGTYFGQSMTANFIYTIAGNGTAGYLADNVDATSTRINYPVGVSVDASGNVYVADHVNNRIRFIPKVGGTYFGQSMTANYIYTIAGNGTGGYLVDNVDATSTQINLPRSVSVDSGGNVYFSDWNNNRIRFVPKVGGTYFGQSMTANYIYTIGGTGNTAYDGENAVATSKNIYQPYGVFAAPDHMVYLTDYNNKVRMIAAEDFIAPSSSSLAAITGAAAGTVDLTWPSAGDDATYNDLTGNYRIQYATYTASWSTASTPTDAFTLTIATTGVVPGVVQSTSIAGLTSGITYYFALFTEDESANWSEVSNTASAMPPFTVTLAEAVGQAGWMGQGETQRILGTAQVVSDSTSGVTISSVAVQASGYTADGNLTNVEVWVSSSGYIDANAIRLEDTAKAFSSNAAVFTQDVAVSTTPLYFIARSDVSGSATEGTFELSLQVYTTAITSNNPIAFSNNTDVVAPPSGNPSGLTATAASNLLQVNLSWSGATGVDSYSIFRATHSSVSTSDFLLGVTDSTSFADDSIPPAQELYYRVLATNRAGSTASGSANATTVDIPALTTSNIYLRAGMPGGFGNGNMTYRETLNNPASTFVDQGGNVYIADSDSHRISFVPKTDGINFGQSMIANYIYRIAGNETAGYLGDGVAATSTRINSPNGVTVDVDGNVYISDKVNNRIRFIPKIGGTYFGQSMTANYIYTIAGNGTAGYTTDGVAANTTNIYYPSGVSVDVGGNVYIVDRYNQRIRFIAKAGGTYFGQTMTANWIYTIAGDGTAGVGPNGVMATNTQLRYPWNMSVDVGGNLYVSDNNSHRIRFVPKIGGTSLGSR
jgi:predicted nucleotidyltransferase